MKKNMKLPMIVAAFAITLMLTVGIGWAQQQQAIITNEKIDEYQGCGAVYFDGEVPPFCPIAEGAQVVLDGIASGEFTFTELQAYFDSISGSSYVMNSVPEISFDGPMQTPIGDDITSIEDIKDYEKRVFIADVNVIELLYERLPQADIYCEAPEGDHPDDWRFHPKALCLAAGMTFIVGVSMANAIVSAFYALFGGVTWLLGMTQWTLVLRGFGLGASAIELGIEVYEDCMDAIGGGAQTG